MNLTGNVWRTLTYLQTNILYKSLKEITIIPPKFSRCILIFYLILLRKLLKKEDLKVKYYTTLISALSTLFAYLIPILSFNKFFNGELYFYNGMILLVILLIVNILSIIHGDRLVNFFLLCLSIIATLIFTFPIWRTFILNSI